MAGSSLSSSIPQGRSPVRHTRVLIPNKHGENLSGLLHDTGSLSVVVLCHGFQSTKEDKTILTIIDALTRAGISSFHFDFSGNGESEGSFQYGNYLKEVDDLRVVMQYLSAQKYKTSAIIGHSKGGNVALLYASKYHDVPVVVNISGRFALERGMEGRLGRRFMERMKREGFIDVKDKTGKVEYRVTQQNLKDRLGINMQLACLSIDKECRVLTVHGSADRTVPPEDAFEFANVIPSHKLKIIEGADHNYTAHQVDLASVVMDFIQSDQRTQSLGKENLFSRL